MAHYIITMQEAVSFMFQFLGILTTSLCYAF